MGICQYTGAPFCMQPEAQIYLGTALGTLSCEGMRVELVLMTSQREIN
jgi:hypothetical protein